MCSADGPGGTEHTREAIHVVSAGGHPVAAFTRSLAPTGTLRIDNKYYRASVPLRAYDSLDSVPAFISGALVVVMVVEKGVLGAFEEVTSWWAARKADGDHEVDVPLIVAWGVGEDEQGGAMDDVFAWSVDEGFELVHCPADSPDSGTGHPASGTMATSSMAARETRETSGMERVIEALQNCRWSMAQVKETTESTEMAGMAGCMGMGVDGPLGLGVRPDRFARGSEARDDLAGDDIEPNWQRMNEDVLRAFARLAACGSDSEGDSEGEEMFSKLASMLRKQ